MQEEKAHKIQRVLRGVISRNIRAFWRQTQPLPSRIIIPVVVCVDLFIRFITVRRLLYSGHEMLADILCLYREQHAASQFLPDVNCIGFITEFRSSFDVLRLYYTIRRLAIPLHPAFVEGAEALGFRGRMWP